MAGIDVNIATMAMSRLSSARNLSMMAVIWHGILRAQLVRVLWRRAARPLSYLVITRRHRYNENDFINRLSSKRRYVSYVSK